MSNWPNLPNDLLRCISSSVSLPDHHRLSSVCKSWNLVGDEKGARPFGPELPWIVLGQEPGTRKRNFFSLSEQRPYCIDIPELYGQHICGSSFGWLFTIDLALKCRLLNPFTRESIELPPLPPFNKTTNNANQLGWTFEEMQRRMIFKAVLSHDPRERERLDFTVMIIFGGDDLLALWKPGDLSWTVPESPLHEEGFIFLTDVIFFRGKFYIVSDSRHFFVLDVGSPSKLTRIKPRIPRFDKKMEERYLVDFQGELLLVHRYKKYSKSKPKKEIRVIKLDLQKETWEELQDLGGFSLFIGNNSAIVVDPRRFPNCVGNAVYLADTCDSQYWEKMGHQYGVYYMVDNIMGRFCFVDDCFLPHNAPICWISPN